MLQRGAACAKKREGPSESAPPHVPFPVPRRSFDFTATMIATGVTTVSVIFAGSVVDSIGRRPLFFIGGGFGHAPCASFNSPEKGSY